VRWSDQAKADLKAIYDYIARDSKHYAKQVTRELVDKADGLAGLPRLGRVVPELGDENVREIPAHSYRILSSIDWLDCD
jgi:plasmid stabilization system protein ParE